MDPACLPMARRRRALASPTRANGCTRCTDPTPRFTSRLGQRTASSRPYASRIARRLMREIRALIVDDEPLARRGIRQLLDREKDVTVIAEARNGRDALRALRTLNPDLVFLDVQMPEVDGFAVLRAHGPERMPAVIFVTAYDAFAGRA